MMTRVELEAAMESQRSQQSGGLVLERQVLAQAPELAPSAFVDGDRHAFLATDIEDSTTMWDADPDAMATALRRHDEILGESVVEAGGRIFKRTRSTPRP
jgi:class 3 adenylate cyclase